MIADQAQFFAPGAGLSPMPQIHLSAPFDPGEAMQRHATGVVNSLNVLQQGLIAKKEMAMREAIAQRQMALEQQKMALAEQRAQKDSQMEMAKFNNLMNQQSIENARDSKKLQLETMKYELDSQSKLDKIAQQETLARYAPLMMEDISKAEDRDSVLQSENTQKYFSALSKNDPSAASAFMKDALANKFPKDKDDLTPEQEYTYSTFNDWYANKLPDAISKVDQGMPFKDAVADIRDAVNQGLKDGTLDPKTVQAELPKMFNMVYKPVAREDAQTFREKQAAANRKEYKYLVDGVEVDEIEASKARSQNKLVTKIEENTGNITDIGTPPKPVSKLEELMAAADERRKKKAGAK